MKRNEKPNCKPGQTMDAKEMVSLLIKDFHIDMDDPRLTLGRKWKNLVGEKCASHSSPYDLRGEVLYVKADHPVWVQLITLQQAKIIERLGKVYPNLSVKRIHVLLSK